MVCMKEAELQCRIAELKKQKAEVKGTECEVFSRCCGYLRPVQAWNDGKKQEFALRSKYDRTAK